MPETFDFIVVGGGTAGCTVASRLTEDASVRVLLLEAGKARRDRKLMVRVPIAWHPTSEAPEFGWGFHTEPEESTGGRVLHQPRGKLLGGTSSINGMMYSRGNPCDYDSWAAMGLQGWSYAEILPYFRRSESNWRGDGPFHGGSGPLRVMANPKEPAIYPHMIAAAGEMGYRELDDFHGPSQEGFGMPDFTVRGGERESSATAYLTPARNRPNLTVVTGATVLRVVLDGNRAKGVEYAVGGNVASAAAGEVIVSGGAFNSPQLLQLSGIGAPDALAAVGVTPRHDLPAVGQNLQDHPLVAAVFNAARPLGFNRLLRLDQLAMAAMRWAASRSGPLVNAPLSVQGYLRTQEDAQWPDTQFQVSHVSFMSRPWFPGWRKGAGHQFTAAAMQLRPEGRGSVMLKSSDPRMAPEIRLGLLATEYDREHARRMLRFIRDFFASDALSDLVAGELFPGRALDSDEAIDAHLRDTIHTGMHPTSSCAMGNDPARSVVDAALKVHGMDGLRIVDASVMPRIVAGNTSAPSIMIAEKAADMLLGKAPLTPASLPA